MAIEVKDVLERLEGQGFLRKYFPEAEPPNASGWMKFKCPFHADTNPSATFNIDTKGFKCFACNKTGSAIDLLSEATKKPRHLVVELLARELGVSSSKTISGELIEGWHSALRLNADVLKALEIKKGLSIESIIRWRLGWNQKLKRLIIPVRDEAGNVINVRQYDLLKVHDPRSKMTNLRGHGSLHLYPAEMMKQDDLVVTEGELKALHLIQLGINAVSPSGGANSWDSKWDTALSTKSLQIVYDIDDTGLVRSRDLARRLQRHGAKVKLITLPLDKARHPHGDVIDYFMEGYGAQDFKNLVLGTPLYEPSGDAPPSGLRDDLTYEVAVASVTKAQYYMRKVRFNGVISSKDTAPFLAPSELRVRCSRDQEYCVSCEVYSSPADSTMEMEKDDLCLLELIDIDSKRQRLVIREVLGIPVRCSACKLLIDEAYNLEETRIVGQLGVTEASGMERGEVHAYSIGHGLEPNASYRFSGRVGVMPKSQHATCLIGAAEPNVDNLSTFSPTLDELRELEIFRPAKWTMEGIQQKLDEIYDDFEHNVTHIYRRRPLHTLMDLAWHSVLEVRLGNQAAKGWLDVLVIGDSGQGKSETANQLRHHYGLGERVDIKTSSVAGIKGGLQKFQDRWFITWGTIPLNDRRLVILEEAKGCPVEVLQSLTDMRSSGIAEIGKIEHSRTNARTRLIWISNPRSDRGVMTYNYGVETVRELMGSLEDVRRFDAAIVVASNEVSSDMINDAARLHGAPVPHLFTSMICQRLVLWAWSREANHVIFKRDTERCCLDSAKRLAEKFSSAIPLVEPADQRFKVARLAAAIAARTFSTDDNEKLVVLPCHVEWVEAFLVSIYGMRASAYQEFSAVEKADTTLITPDEIREAVQSTLFPKDTVTGLLKSAEVKLTDLEDWSGFSGDQVKGLLSLLVRRNALKRRGFAYVKTSAFIELLKKMDNNGALKESPTYEKESRRAY